ncbi:MAG: cell division protein SepF [Bacillota bacterium]|nr:cell division protein SepF [Bacillota bacterium]
MAKVLDRILSLLGYQEEVEEYEEEVKGRPGEEGSSRRVRVVTFPGARAPERAGARLRVVVVALSQFDEVQIVADHLKEEHPVVANLLNLDRETAKRVVDFLNGTVYALDGHVQKVSDGIYLFVPADVEIDAEHALLLHDHGMLFLQR